MTKSVTDDVVADILGQERLHAIIEQAEEMPHNPKSQHGNSLLWAFVTMCMFNDSFETLYNFSDFF